MEDLVEGFLIILREKQQGNRSGIRPMSLNVYTTMQWIWVTNEDNLTFKHGCKCAFVSITSIQWDERFATRIQHWEDKELYKKEGAWDAYKNMRPEKINQDE